MRAHPLILVLNVEQQPICLLDQGTNPTLAIVLRRSQLGIVFAERNGLL